MTDKEKAIVMAYTKTAMLTGAKLDVFYEYISTLLDRPVFSHQLADEMLWEVIHEKSRDDFIKLCKEGSDAIPIDFIKSFNERLIDRKERWLLETLVEVWEHENETN